MRLFLEGHAERYAVEQLQMSLFPDEPMEYCERPFEGDGAVSVLRRVGDMLEGETRIQWKGRAVSGQRRMPASAETVPARRRLLQQSYYLAAVQLLAETPAWGALAGVRPTKLTTRAMLDGKTAADRPERDAPGGPPYMYSFAKVSGAAPFSGGCSPRPGGGSGWSGPPAPAPV